MLLMIIAQQVEQAVYHEEVKFIMEIHAGFPGIAFCPLSGDNDVSQDGGVDGAKFSFRERKGDNVGNVIPCQIGPVYFPDRIVVHEKQG